MFDRCPICSKPLVNGRNLRILRGLVLGVSVGTGLLSAAMLPLLGFGTGGIVGGSMASAWQSSIGLVSSESLFAALQSLGATGMGTLICGSIGAALPLLGLIAPHINCCVCVRQ